jgi:hypothetical protein
VNRIVLGKCVRRTFASRLERVPFGARVLAFALAAMIATGFIVGFAPAIRLAGTSPSR